jgi:hypothetical protein
MAGGRQLWTTISSADRVDDALIGIDEACDREVLLSGRRPSHR